MAHEGVIEQLANVSNIFSFRMTARTKHECSAMSIDWSKGQVRLRESTEADVSLSEAENACLPAARK